MALYLYEFKGENSLKNFLENLLLFKEPKQTEKFILKENKQDTEKDSEKASNKNPSQKSNKSKEKDGDTFLDKILGSNQGDDEQEPGAEKKEEKISKKLSTNLKYMKKVYSIPKNGDIVLRAFDIVVKDKTIPAFILFYDGMTDREVINNYILTPLMLLSNLDIKGNERKIIDYIKNHILPQSQLNETSEYTSVIDEINFGGCGIFIDGIDVAFAADVKGWEHRNVERPNSEQVLRGPQEGFTEILRVNTALVRKILKDEKLIVEDVIIGKRSKTPCSMLYLRDITNESLVEEMRRRLESIKIDYLIDSGELEQLLEESSLSVVPQLMATERPDMVAAHIADGKIGVIVHGSPFVLLAPVTLVDLLQSPEDAYMRLPYAHLLRFVRFLGIFFSLLLPGLYIAITSFHQEMIPTDLVFSIEASREVVPFPSVVELLLMEVMFELIREAGIRIPGPIGPTLGIIGALILGQAAVEASIVSPILIIIVAITGIGSFAVPNYSLGLSFRVLRFGYIFLGAMAGFLGITLGLFIQGILFVNSKSFGVPVTIPTGPKTATSFSNNRLIRLPLWKQERRADYLNTQDDTKQPKISRKWTEDNKKRKGDGDEE